MPIENTKSHSNTWGNPIRATLDIKLMQWCTIQLCAHFIAYWKQNICVSFPITCDLLVATARDTCSFW